MIQLRNIKKSFFQEQVLKDFSYDFDDYGFYLIYGPSGSGKTTLINIISLYMPPDCGKIFYNGNNLTIQNKNQYDLEIAYLTQDAYFIYYLTIKDNLEASGADMELARELIDEFSLVHVLEKYPDQLSGGEKQRITIIQAMALRKNILILDEPTSALDEENKEKVFHFLASLKNRVLIIFVSHDEAAKHYADFIIDFHQIELYISEFPIVSSKPILKRVRKKRNLYAYVKQQRKYKKREKKSIVILTLIVIIQFLAVFFCANPESKIINSLGNDYHLNYLNIEVPKDKLDQIEDLWGTYPSIQSIVYGYNKGGDYCNKEVDCEMTKGLVYPTLPFNQSFYYYDHLIEGTYFKDSHDIILGSEYAYKMNPNIGELIGDEIVFNTAYGEETFNIVGIFDAFSKEEQNYFKGGFPQEINQNLFFNEKFTEKFLQDDVLADGEKIPPYNHSFIVYFDSFDNLMQFYNDNYHEDPIDDEWRIHPIGSYLIRIISDFMGISFYLLPILALNGILVIAFYMQMQIIKLQHTMDIFGVYQYYGFTWNEIKKAYKKYYLIEISSTLCIAAGISCILILPFNRIIKYFQLYPYDALSFSFSYLLISFLFLFITSVMFVNIKMKSLKKINWFELIKARRDLL